jgi:UDP-N-acetylenolpyruvoylglucosamine reductase
MARTVVSGRCVVTTAGTRVQLGGAGTTMTPTSVDGVISKLVVCSNEANTGLVVIGGSGVVAAAGTRNGVVINEVAPIVLEDLDDLGDLWVDATVNGDSLNFIATVA